MKKLIILGSLTVFCALAFSIPTVKAGVCEDVNDAMPDFLQSDCGSEDITSFIDFKGGLTAPAVEGLDPTLTRAKTAREFIKNTLNFVLSFLGIVALAVVIYGGFLYITAAGNEEQSGKGKKALTYAAVGIIIIIASFGLVNTLITSVGGEGAGGRGEGSSATVRGVGEEGSNIGQAGIYNLAAGEINASLNDFLGAYKNRATIHALIEKMKGFPEPSDTGREANNKRYLSEVGSVLTEIKNSTNSLTKTHVAVKGLIDGWVTQAQAANLASEAYENGAIKNGPGNASSGEAENRTVGFDKALVDSELEQASKDDFSSAINQLIGSNTTTSVTGLTQWAPLQSGASEIGTEAKLAIIAKILGPVAQRSAGNSASTAVQRGLSEQDITRAFAGINPNWNVGDVLLATLNSLVDARSLGDDPLQPEKVLKVAKSLNLLYLVVKNIEFVFVKMKTTIQEGNAPLTVELSGLDSRDPTGDTVSDERYEWDPEGLVEGAVTTDVALDLAARRGPMGIKIPSVSLSATPYVECMPATKRKATISCTYNHPGTYIVSLKIVSTDPSRVAEGQAFLAITVHPSIGRIGLNAEVGDRKETLQKYEEDEAGRWNPIIDKSEFQVTTSQAKDGITFDASSSQSGDGTNIDKFEWSFGDDSRPENKATVEHKYKREGRFPLRLEITNASGRKARKVIQVIVASIVSVVQPSITIGEPDELIEFDGSQSKSDQGAISSYHWKLEKLISASPEEWTNVLNDKNEVSVIGSEEASTLRVKIKHSGRYRAILKVNDASGDATDTEEISIRSRKPRANFGFAFPFPTEKPNLVELDADSSFDPDNDPLLFKWTVIDNQGNTMNPNAGFTVEEGTFPDPNNFSKDLKKIRLKFTKLGKFKIRLEVQDEIPDSNLQQIDIREKEIEIKSIVESEFDDDQQKSGKLENGVAEFKFKGTVWSATRAEIDFGDSETLEQSIELTGPENVGKFDFTHQYRNAGSYLVTLKAVSDDGNGENITMMRVHVGSGNTPLAVLESSIDGREVVLPNPTTDNPKPALEIIRKKAIKFDATHSLNAKGNEGGLQFSWGFGDQKQSTGGVVDHSYQDVSMDGKPYTVTLTVTEETDPTKTNQSTFLVNVVSKKPQVNTLALEKKTAGEITPIEVKLTAEGAEDPDGRITNFQFWYFDPNETERKLGVIDTQSDNATLTVETIGEENEEREYLFCVSVTDNENTMNECKELFQQEELPRLKVKNGPNKAPKAEFTVNRSSVRVNEPVTFSSSSSDEDGQVKEYIWDLEGDGFQDNQPTQQSQMTHRYEKKSPSGGYLVKLKVIDNQNASGYSKEVPVNVEAKSNAPDADFSFQVQPNPPRRVKFFDASKADTANAATLAKWMWDFDTSAEFGCDVEPKPPLCNGNKTDDVDSSDQNPVFDFPPGNQSFQVKLTVEDSDGNVSEPKTLLITLIAGTSGGTGTTTPPAGNKVNASLRAVSGTGRTSASEQIPGCSPATAEQCKRKVVHIPAESESEEITLFWGESLGDIISYKIDKDVYCDWDARGGPRARDDDVQNPDLTGGTCVTANDRLQTANCFTAKYHRYNKTAHPSGKGRFKTMLTVEDREGNIDTDFVDIIFDGQTDPAKVLPDRCERTESTLTGSLFKNIGTQNTILLGLGAGVIVVLIGFGMTSFMRRGRRRV